MVDSSREAFEREWLDESRKLNPACGCEKRGTRQFYCSYHEGASDIVDEAWKASRSAAIEECAEAVVNILARFDEGGGGWLYDDVAERLLALKGEG